MTHLLMQRTMIPTTVRDSHYNYLPHQKHCKAEKLWQRTLSKILANSANLDRQIHDTALHLQYFKINIV